MWAGASEGRAPPPHHQCDSSVVARRVTLSTAALVIRGSFWSESCNYPTPERTASRFALEERRRHPRLRAIHPGTLRAGVGRNCKSK